MGGRGAARLHQLEEDAPRAGDHRPEQVRASVETGRVAEPRLQISAKPRLRVLAETSIICGQTVRPEMQELPGAFTHVLLASSMWKRSPGYVVVWNLLF